VLAVLAMLAVCGCAGGPRHDGNGAAAAAHAVAPGRLQFVIIPDRTGGERPGVFPRALEAVNLLQPEFVISVGDLIEGSSDDPRVVQAQFDELEQLVGRLDVPFYYVTGNHDISNPMMARMWEERFGPRYYYFVRGDVLFVCLNTEEGHIPGGLELQAARVCHTLAAYHDARFTFVFMHKPVWVEEPVPAWWTRIEQALAGRPYAVFAGHQHTYRKRVRHGRPYYSLATCGGWSYLDGVYAGLFDHVTLVTLSGTNLSVVNLKVDGILPDDVVTDESVAYGQRLSAEGVHTAPVFFEEPVFEAGVLTVTLSNCLQMPMHMELGARAEGRVLVQPMEACVALAPGETAVRVFEVEATRSNTGDPAGVVIVDWRARIEPPGRKAFYTQGTARTGIVRAHVCPRIRHTVTIDGQLDEWPALTVVCTNPVYFGFGRTAWFGPDDASFRFGVQHDDEYVYVALAVNDEVLHVTPAARAGQQDGVELWLQGNPWDAGALGEKPWCILVSPGTGVTACVIHNTEHVPQGVRAACHAAPGGYVIEYAVPRRALIGGEGHALRELYLNIAVNDYDVAGGNGVQLWWQPDHRSRAGYRGAGTFRLNSAR